MGSGAGGYGPHARTATAVWSSTASLTARQPASIFPEPMELTLALLCEEARDRADGRFDILGVFTELSAPGFPAVQDRMTAFFIMQWDADEAGTQAFRADLTAADGTRVVTIEGETEVPVRQPGSSAAQTRLALPLEKIVFPQRGPYHFDLVAGGNVHRACSLFLGERQG